MLDVLLMSVALMVWAAWEVNHRPLLGAVIALCAGVLFGLWLSHQLWSRTLRQAIEEARMIWMGGGGGVEGDPEGGKP